MNDYCDAVIIESIYLKSDFEDYTAIRFSVVTAIEGAKNPGFCKSATRTRIRPAKPVLRCSNPNI